MSAPTILQEMRPRKTDISELPNVRVDMFSLQGFSLAQRIATALSSSNAVPTAFRSHVLKKVKDNQIWEENTNAIGNCLIAIEVAQSVGMSVTAVMQNADVIEGKLRWSGKFVIAAVNASRRFSTLRFDMKNLGPIKATYKEKQGWNNAKKGYDFIDREVTVNNKECIAWAVESGYKLPGGIRTLEQARQAGIPVIESVPVSIKMAVEEGWYSKSGSKWQTMPDLMLQYRAGTFFGNIHAPDVVMGMGKTTEEEFDVIELNQDGSFGNVTTETLRTPPKPVQPEYVPTAETPVKQETGEIMGNDHEPENQSWQPTAEEAAAIHAAEMAEAAAQQAPAPTPTRARRERGASFGGIE